MDRVGLPKVDAAFCPLKRAGRIGSFAAAILLTAAVARAADDVADLDQLQSAFKSVAERVAPTVVAISASTEADDAPASCRTAEMTPAKLQAFLARTTRMVGTGFVITSDGYVLTNDHVVDDAEQLWVTTDDRRVYPAVVVGTDPRSDLAVLKIPARGLPAARLGDGGLARRGQWSIAIGNPFGLGGGGEMCVSVGVISAVHRSLPKLSDKENRLYNDLLQTTAQINPGNSGGPLFDLRGDVVGVNTAVVLPQHLAGGGATNGIGFAIPVDGRLRDVVAHLRRGDELPYGYLGVIVSDPSDAERQAAGLTAATGVRVDVVQPDSPAADVVREGDLIVALAGRPVSDAEDFVRRVGSMPPDQAVSVALRRDEQSTTATVTLRRRRLPVPAVTRATQRLRWGGMLVVPLPPDAADRGPGLLVARVDPSSPFARRGLHEGAVIRSVAGRPVATVVDLQQAINDTPWDRCAIGTADPAAEATASVRE